MNFIRYLTTLLCISGWLLLSSCASGQFETSDLAAVDLQSFGQLIVGKDDFKDYEDEKEADIGKLLADEFLRRHPIYPEVEVNRYVREVGQKVAAASSRPALPYNFHVINEPTINTFSFPGGQIFIYRGLLERLESESLLAAALAHEIAHTTARSPIRKLSNPASGVPGLSTIASPEQKLDYIGRITTQSYDQVIKGYGQKEELKADLRALRYLEAAGYSKGAAIELQAILRRMREAEPGAMMSLLAAHPPIDEREARIKQAIGKAKNAAPSPSDGNRVFREKALDPIKALRQKTTHRYVSSTLCRKMEKDGSIIGAFTSMTWKENDISLVVRLKEMDNAVHAIYIYFYARDQQIGQTSYRMFTAEKPDWAVDVRIQYLGDTALINQVLGPWKAAIYLDSYLVDVIDFEITPLKPEIK